MRTMNVNEINSFILSQFVKNIETRIEELGKQANSKLSKEEIHSIFNAALDAHNDVSTSKVEYIETILKELREKSLMDITEIEKLQDKLNSNSQFSIKLIILGLCIQFLVLYYITYHYAGWDLGEPISYLLGVLIEICAILYFIRRRGDLTQKGIVQLFRGRTRNELFSKRSTNPEAELKTLLDRLKSLETKAQMLRR